MKNIMITATMLTLFATGGVWASSDSMARDHEAVAEAAVLDFENVASADKVYVSVHGLVCDFCARALEKVFSKRDEVVGLTVDLDKGEVVVAMKEGLIIEDETLTKLITDSGYHVTSITQGE